MSLTAFCIMFFDVPCERIKKEPDRFEDIGFPDAVFTKKDVDLTKVFDGLESGQGDGDQDSTLSRTGVPTVVVFVVRGIVPSIIVCQAQRKTVWGDTKSL